MTDTPWLSTEQIAAHLGVKRDTIYKWRVRHAMPAHKVGKLWKFRQPEVDQWVTSGRAGRGAATAIGEGNHGVQAKLHR